MKKKTLVHRRLGVILAASLFLASVFSGCGKEKRPTPEPTETTTETTIGSTEESTEPESDSGQETTETLESTEASETTGTVTETNPAAELLSEKEAFTILIKTVDTKTYTIESMGEFSADGNEYYRYKANSESVTIKPSILVDRKTGQLYYREPDGAISDLTKFPPDNAQTEPVSKEITKEEALETLKKLSAETLELPAELSEYEIQFDSWTTMVGDTECYGINAYADLGSRKQLMGVYYVALDGSRIFGIDSADGDFKELKK